MYALRGLLCQPRTGLAIGFRGGNGETRENHEAGTRREIAERINLLTAAAAEHAASEKKQGNVGTERGSQLVPRGKVQAVARQALETQERRRRIGAGAAQPAAERNPLVDSNPNAAVPAAGAPPQLTGTVDQIAATRGNRGVGAFDGKGICAMSPG